MAMNLIRFSPHAVTLLSLCIAVATVHTHITRDNSTLVTGQLHEKPLPAVTPAQAQPPDDIDPAVVAGWHLFGREEVTPDSPAAALSGLPAADVPVSELPESAIDLTVSGLVTHQDETLGHAIIADENGREMSYSVGDEIRARVRLHAVLDDRVIINNNNRLEAVSLPALRTDSAERAQHLKTQELQRLFRKQATASKNNS